MRSLFCLAALAAFLSAAEPIEYHVRFPNAVHHEAEISVTFQDVTETTLEVRMSRSSPGRYALHEFAKNVYRVQAFDGSGNELAITRPDPHQWNITGHDGTVIFHYTLFGDLADGTYAAIDQTHAHLNIPATFVWARGLDDRPIHIRFEPPQDSAWRVATQLKPTADPLSFEAPDLAYFLDSPVELSDFEFRQWEVADEKGTQTLRLAVHHQGTTAEVDSFRRMAQAVVREEMAIFGELPEFDFGTYTFIADFLPWTRGDGMEHRNSTILTSRRELKTDGVVLASTLAHEFFHCWNVERLRPRSIEPFDFERVNMSGELWFAEGFTSYYESLTMHRSKLVGTEGFADWIASTLDTVLRAPGRNFVSPAEASRRAPFADGAATVDPVNRENTYISYYTYGAAVGLGLDLTLRTKFEGVTLDHYMRALWREFGRLERPYTPEDLRRVLGEVAGDGAFADDFFDRHIDGRQAIDYAALLSRAGFRLLETDKGKASLGRASLRFGKDGALVESRTLIGGPLYEAGIDQGATIRKVDGRGFQSRQRLDKILEKRKPGAIVAVEYEQRGRKGVTKVTLGSIARLEVVPFEECDEPLTADARRVREAWLGSQADAR